jgi:hypothetical protein
VDADITELDLTISHVHEIHHQWSQEVTVPIVGRASRVAGVFLFKEEDHQPTVVTLGGRVSRTVSILTSTQTRKRCSTGDDRRDVAPFGDCRSQYSASARHRQSRVSHHARPPVTLVTGTAYYTDHVQQCLDAKDRPGAAREEEHVHLRLGDARVQRSAASTPRRLRCVRLYPEWAWSWRRRGEDRACGKRATLNVAAFHTDYSDLQVQTAIRPGVIDISMRLKRRFVA